MKNGQSIPQKTPFSWCHLKAVTEQTSGGTHPIVCLFREPKASETRGPTLHRSFDGRTMNPPTEPTPDSREARRVSSVREVRVRDSTKRKAASWVLGRKKWWIKGASVHTGIQIIDLLPIWATWRTAEEKNYPENSLTEINHQFRAGKSGRAQTRTAQILMNIVISHRSPLKISAKGTRKEICRPLE